MNLLILLSVIFVIFMALMIFVSPFRRKVVSEVKAIAAIVMHYLPGWLKKTAKAVGFYSFGLAMITVLAFFLMIIAILIGSPALTGFVFLLALALVLLAWLPAGIILKTFGLADEVVPKGLKVMIAWLAFIGFLGLIAPGVFTYYTMVGAALVALILMASSMAFNVMDRLIIPLVIVMCLTLAWQEFFPDSFRSSVRYASSWSKKFDTFKDRSSIANESDAATTYGVLLKSVNTLYQQGSSGLTEIETNIPRGTIVLIASHKDELLVISGQSFVVIRLMKDNGSFVNGTTYLIESEFIQIAAPRDIVPEDNSLLPSKKGEKTVGRRQAQVLCLGDNIFEFNTAGEKTQWLKLPSYSNISNEIWSINGQFLLVFSDGTRYGNQDRIPEKADPEFYIYSKDSEIVNIVLKIEE